MGEAQLSGHLVVVGWKSDMVDLVGRAPAGQPGRDPGTVVLVNAAGESANEELRQRFPGIGYVHGDTVDPGVLSARAPLARAAWSCSPTSPWRARTRRPTPAP